MYLVASFPSPSPLVPHRCFLSSLEKQVRFRIPWLAFRRPHCQIAVDPPAMILCTRSRLLQAVATSLMRDHVAGVHDPYLHAQVTTITQHYECMPHLRSTSNQICSSCGLSFQSLQAFFKSLAGKARHASFVCFLCEGDALTRSDIFALNQSNISICAISASSRLSTSLAKYMANACGSSFNNGISLIHCSSWRL
jgi:hypothetical protein